MTSSPKPPGQGGADLEGSAAGSVGAAPLDPIFDAPEPEERTSKTGALLWQYFFFPVLMVAGAVGVFVAFGAWGGSVDSEKELLETVLSGSENAQKQAAQQLAIAIAQARGDADAAAASWREGQPRPKPPFFADPAFAERLRHAFVLARRDGENEQRQVWLAKALGRAADPDAVPLLLETLYPAPDAAKKPTIEVRRAAAQGLLYMESRIAEEALVRAAADPGDAEVRAIATSALALLGMVDGGAAADRPGTQPALTKALGDPHAGVRLNAAVGLAVRGDAAGLSMLERSLARADLLALGVQEQELQRNALVNAVRAVVALATAPSAAAAPPGLAGLRGRIETLAREDGDENVRRIAREGLERWRTQ